MSTPISCPHGAIERTLEVMWTGGARNCEALVLWLARRSGDFIEVVDAYEPPYLAKVDQFYIPPEGMRVIMARLRAERLHICAQVHSHPERAFHSLADDTWAIVRHQGALSLVVPWFGATSSAATFLETVAAYELSIEDTWKLVPTETLKKLIEVTHAHGPAGE